MGAVMGEAGTVAHMAAKTPRTRRKMDPVLALRRVSAVMIDGFALQLPAALMASTILAAVIQVSPNAEALFASDWDRLTAWSIGSFALVSTLAEAAILARWGTTPGRRTFGIQLVGDSDRRPRYRDSVRYCSTRLLPSMVVALYFPPALALIAAVQLASWWLTGVTIQEHLSGLRVVRRG
jgi:hypothetical protein